MSEPSNTAESAQSAESTEGKRKRLALVTEADIRELFAGKRNLPSALASFAELTAILKDAETAEESNAKSEADALVKFKAADPDTFQRLTEESARIENELEALKAERANNRAEILNSLESYRDTAGIDTGALSTEYDVAVSSLSTMVKTGTGRTLADYGKRFESLPSAFGRQGGVGMPRIGKAEVSRDGGKTFTSVSYSGKGATTADLNRELNEKCTATAKFWREQFSVGSAIPTSGLTSQPVSYNSGPSLIFRIYPRPSESRK